MAGQPEMMVSSAPAKVPKALAVFNRLQNAASVSGFTAKDVPPIPWGWLTVENVGEAAGGPGSSRRDAVGSPSQRGCPAALLLPPRDAPTASVLCATTVGTPLPGDNLEQGLILPGGRGSSWGSSRRRDGAAEQGHGFDAAPAAGNSGVEIQRHPSAKASKGAGLAKPLIKARNG